MAIAGWDSVSRLLDRVQFDSDAVIIGLLGLPLAGKSTLGRHICNRFGINRLSTGDWFRNHISQQTTLGDQIRDRVLGGDLLPIPLAQLAVARQLAEPSNQFRQGILFDGFPRTIRQAELLANLASGFRLKLAAMVHLDLPIGDLNIRAEMRRICSNNDCQEAYGWALPEALTPGICNRCGHELIRRPDDNPEILRKRVTEDGPRIAQLVELYRQQGLLETIDAGNHLTLSDTISQCLEKLNLRLGVTTAV